MAKKNAGVVEEVRYAMSHRDSDDLIDGVKKAVIKEVKRLDPGIKIERTNYFNHTYNPDLVATWSDQGTRRSRPIFLRGSLASVLKSADVTNLADRDPVLIGLSDDTKPVLSKLRRQLPKSNGALATQVSSVAQIVGARGSEHNDVHLSDLVRANLVRGGRGVLGSTDAEDIATVESTDASESLEAFRSTVENLFVGATADRLNRTVDMLSTFFERDPDQVELDRVAQESLSDSELSVVLPYVLERAQDVQSQLVWNALSEMLTLQRLENMVKSLAGLDLTPLIVPMVDRLVGARSTVSFTADEITPEEMQARPATWKIRGSMLSADVGVWDFYVGSSARKIRGRDDGADARWKEVSAQLREFDLQAVSLRGLTRKLEVTGDNPQAVREDVEAVRNSIHDDFHVPAVTLRLGEESEVTVDFGAMTATGKAPVAFHLRAASLLARKAPFAEEQLNVLLGDPKNSTSG